MGRGATPPQGKKPGSGRNYVRGRAKEYRATARLRAWGYTVVRSAKSHGPADLLAGKALANFSDGTTQHRLLAVQVKGGARGLGRLSQEDRGALVDLARAFGAEPVAQGPGGRWFLVVPCNGPQTAGARRWDLAPLDDAWF